MTTPERKKKAVLETSDRQKEWTWAVVPPKSPKTLGRDAADIPPSPWILFGGIFLVASLGGLAALLRSDKPIGPRHVWSALLNSGIAGLIIAFLMWRKFGQDDLFFLIGVSILAGFGGASAVDAIVQWFRRWIMSMPVPAPPGRKDDGYE